MKTFVLLPDGEVKAIDAPPIVSPVQEKDCNESYEKVNKYVSPNFAPSIYSIEKHEFAENLRTHMTMAEQILWPEIQVYGFYTQKIVFGYIADFINFQKKILIEVDGGVHSLKKRKQHDYIRDEVFRRHEYLVIRVTNDEVINRPSETVEKIKEAFFKRAKEV